MNIAKLHNANQRTALLPAIYWLGIALLLAAQSNLVAQSLPSQLLASRGELTSELSRAETAATNGDASRRTHDAMTAAANRLRLEQGDFQVGDRIAVSFVSDALHRDTVVVKPGLYVELAGMGSVPLAGVLRAELQERLSREILKYVKAQQLEVTPLVRVGILGAVARPGYFTLAPDVPIAQAIMAAGGPSASADVNRSVVRRRNEEFRSADETRRAIAGGLTLDQFGLSAGDELMVGQRSDKTSRVIGLASAMASILALVVATRR